MTDETVTSPANTPTATEPAPDPYADDGAILGLVNRKLGEWSKGRQAAVRAAWRNILFYRGHQWIKFDRFLNRFRPAFLPKSTPTPVTNKFASTIDAVISVLARVEPRLNFQPATTEPEDRATADVASRAMEIIEDETNIRLNRQHMGVWSGLTGGVWLETGYDADPIHGTRWIGHEECFGCGQTAAPTEAQTCQACGGRLFIPAVGPDGAPIGHEVPVGRMFVDVVSLFEMYFDPSVSDWRTQREVVRKKSVSLDEAKARWPDFADRIQPDSLSSAESMYTGSLATLGANVDDTTAGQRGLAIGQPATALNSRVIEKWYWSLSTKDYPDGLCAVVVNETLVVHKGPLPYSALAADGHRTPFLPFVFFPQKVVPGTAWPKTVADDLAHKAAQRNRIESLLEAILMRSANPVWLVPEGANVVNPTGEPAQIIKYNPLGPVPGAKPERIPGQGLPAGLMIFLELIDKDFEELGATFDVIKGTRPEGVSAGIALQILQERAMSRFGPMFILWEVAWAEWARQAVEVFREFATEERMLRIKGRDGRWQVDKFLGADLQGRVNIIPEAMSSVPRSSLVEKAMTEQLVAMGVLNVGDPETRFKILEEYGRASWLPGMAADTKNAIMENEQFEALAQDPRTAMIAPQDLEAIKLLPPETVVVELARIGLAVPRVRPSVDDHGVHAREHRNHLKSEIGQAMPLVVQLLEELHTQQHDQFAAQQMMAMMQARAGTTATSGFLSNPGGQVSPMRQGSSPARVAGDIAEMGDRMAATAP